MAGLGKAAGGGVRWLAVGQGGKRILQVGTIAVLAHLLSPRDFGIVGLALVITDFALIFRDLGTSSAVIRSAEVTPRLLNTVFWTNVAFALGAAAVIFALAPLAARFYGEPALTGVLRALSVSFLIAGASILQQAQLERRLAFDALAGIEFTSALLGSVAGITCAVLGWGVWSLVAQTLIMQVAQTALLWRASGWRPRREFDWRQLRAISGFSLHLTGSQVVDFVWRNADKVLIGRVLGSTALGYYSIAYRILLYPIQSVSHVVGRALFPVYVQFQADHARFRAAYVRVAGAIAMLTFPTIAGVMALRGPFVETVLGPGWQPVAPLLLILGPLAASQSVGATTGMIYLTTGRTDRMFRWAVIACVASLVGYSVGLRWGIQGVAWGEFAATVVLFERSFAIPFELVNLRWREFLRPLAAPFVASGVMAGAVWALETMAPAGLPAAVRLGLLVAAGAGVYGVVVRALAREQLQEIWQVAAARKPAVETA